MNDITLWLSTGLAHILDLEGYDHICYVVALAVLFSWREWKSLLILLTAFTIGHSLSLALSTLNAVKIEQKWIEILIPITIIITCLTNLFTIFIDEKRFEKSNYLMALGFGLIHGLGFSYLLKMMLSKESSVILPLFSFNVGLEIGQIIIISLTLFIAFLLVEVVRLQKKYWQAAVSIAVLMIAVYLLFNRI